MKNIAIIPARGRSESVLNKNIKILGDKPLITYTIETALKCKSIDRVIVSTDSEEIAEISKKNGAEVPFLRTGELALNTTPMLPVLRHAVEWLEKNENEEIKNVILLDPTAPLRKVSDIEDCIEMLENENADSAVTVCEAEHNPYFVMREIKEDRLVPLLKTEKPIYRRQDSPKVYRINAAVYAIKRDILMESGIFTENTKAVIMPQDRSIHIDSLMDFKIAELLLGRCIDEK